MRTDAPPGPEVSQESSLRERKKLATRRAIHQAAFDLVSARGLSGVTVEAISERAGVAPRTFWSYFRSKEEAVVDHDPQRPRSLATDLLARPVDEDPLTALRRVFTDDMSRRWSDPTAAHRLFELIHSNPHLMAAAAAAFDEVTRALVSALAQRLGTDPDADLFAGVMVNAAIGTCRVAGLRWGNPDDHRDLPELLDDAFSQLARGLAPLTAGTGR